MDHAHLHIAGFRHARAVEPQFGQDTASGDDAGEARWDDGLYKHNSGFGIPRKSNASVR